MTVYILLQWVSTFFTDPVDSLSVKDVTALKLTICHMCVIFILTIFL